VSVTKEVCDHQIYGKGLEGYIMAIDYILNNQK
jgi:3-dehydroquinate dehydratase-2